ncbi:MAG: sigma-70 family RNA polymerase sigma factor [Ectothiorhodospiraceae bacterium AqS1]|nr:sigma-70 family RNA polymerase sigma factor [Ectothiorhodospiraceae bacterium AqS1]
MPGKIEQASERELIQRSQQGDRGAFDLLVLRYQRKVGHIVSHYIQDPSEVLDVTQEVFVRAWRGLKGFRGESGFHTWIYRIATNTSKTYLMGQIKRKRRVYHEAEVMDGDLTIDASEWMIFDISETPEDMAESDEIRQAVVEAFEALPVDLKAVATMRELEGLSYEEIGRIIGCSPNIVRARLYRARTRIYDSIAPVLERKRRRKPKRG